MAKRPSFQFYPADWINDINMRTATYEEKGFLIDLMCLLHQSNKYGYLTKEMEENLAELLGKDRRTSRRLLVKVQQKSLMKRDEKTGELFSKRMAKDEYIRGIRQAAGVKGGNPNLVKQKVKQVSKQKITPSSSTSSSTSKTSTNVDTDKSDKTEYGNKEINQVLKALKKSVGIEAFVDSGLERNIAKHCVGLIGKIGAPEFKRRLDHLLVDEFHSKNCNKIKYIYNNIKGFKEPIPNQQKDWI